MGLDNTKINDDLIRFWDEAFSNNQIEEPLPDYLDLAPSKKLAEAATRLGKCQRVLDYGCGSAWASIIAAKTGCPHIDAVDLGKNIILNATSYAKAYKVEDFIHPKLIDASWLGSIPSPIYDGLICSNVLDVVPIETAKEILEGFSKILLPNALAVIGLNFYLSIDAAKAKGLELQEERYLFVNGTLRLSSFTDEEWIYMLSPYFEVLSLDHFAWPNEPKETRRLFLLRRHSS